MNLAIIFIIIIVILLVLLLLLKPTTEKTLKNYEELDVALDAQPEPCVNITTPEICKLFEDDITTTDIINFTNSNQKDEAFAKNGALILGKFLTSLEKNKLTSSLDYVKIFWDKDPKLPICIIINKNIVIFRGTKTFKDLMEDITFKQVNIGGNYMVHEGFYNLYSSIKGDIFKNLDLSQEIYVAGHSLGCGLSILLTFDLINNAKKINTLIVAPPKVGNRDFANYVSKNPKTRVVSIINLADAVPAFPFSYMTYKKVSYQYSHSGNIITFYTLANTLASCHSVYTYFTFLYNIKN